MTRSKDKVVAITGASGLLGRALLKEFTSSGQWKKVVGTAFSRSGGQLVKVDLSNTEAIKEFVKTEKPDFVVHAAAQRFPDKVDSDPEGARRLNVEATEALAKALDEYGGRMVYISTDYVFEGDKPPYKVEDAPNPLNMYGQLKLDGERATLNVNEGNLVLRIPVLYGDVEYLGESAVTTLLSQLKDGKPASTSDYEVRRPSHVQDIAKISQALILKKLQDSNGVSGIFQWSGSEAMTKYGMILSMAEVFGLDSSHVSGNREKPTGGTKRPYDVTMDTSRLLKLDISFHTNFKEGIRQSLSKWV